MKPLTNGDGVILVQNAVDNHNTLVDKLSYAQDKMTQDELAYLIEHYCIESHVNSVSSEYDFYTIRISGGTHFIAKPTSGISVEENKMFIFPIGDNRILSSLLSK